MVEIARAPAYGHPGEPAVAGCGDPAVLVERAVSEHLEVLDVSRARRLRIVERVHHADALDRLLPDAVDLHRLGKVRRLEDSGWEGDDVVELRAGSARVLDQVRPRDPQRIARPAQVRRHLLAPLEGGVRVPGPADGDLV